MIRSLIFLLLTSFLQVVNGADLFAYVSLTWQNELLSVIEANEQTLVNSLQAFATPFASPSNNVSAITASIQTIDLLGSANLLTNSGNFKIEMVVTAKGNITSESLVAYLLSAGDVGANLTYNLPLGTASTIQTTRISYTPSQSWLQLNPPATILSVMGSTNPFLLVTLSFQSPNILHGVSFTASTLCRMRASMQQLLNTTTRFIPMSVANTTQFGMIDTLVVHAYAIGSNTTASERLRITNTLIQGQPLDGTNFLRLGDIMGNNGFNQAFDYGMMISVDIQNINPTPVQVTSSVDGGIIDNSIITDFKISDTSLAPIISTPSIPCPTAWCLNLAWNNTGNNSFLLSRIKAAIVLNGTVFSSSVGARILPGNSTVWTLYGVNQSQPFSHVIFDLLRPSDMTKVSVDVTAAMLNSNEATSTVKSTSSSALYVQYRAYLRNGNEFSLMLHLLDGSPGNTSTYASEEIAACALCAPLGQRCQADTNCSLLMSCLQTSIANSSEAFFAAPTTTIGSVLDITANVTSCMWSPPAASPSRQLFTKYMQCVMARTCPFYANASSQLTWYGSSVGWQQLKMNRLSDLVPLKMNITTPYNSGQSSFSCPLSIIASQLPSDIASTIQNCMLNDSEVTVVYNLDRTATLPITFDIMHSMSLSPLPGLILPSPIPTLTLATMQTLRQPAVGLLMLPIANYSSIPNLVPPTDPCKACWSLFMNKCLNDPTCTTYTNCIMQDAFPSISLLLSEGNTNDTVDLSYSIRKCSNTSSFTLSGAWRTLQNISSCYATTTCTVAPTSRVLNNVTKVIWHVPDRVQTLIYVRPSNSSAILQQVTALSPMSISTSSANYSQTSLQNALQQVLQWNLIELSPEVITQSTNNSIISTWMVTFHTFTGFLPTYTIVDTNNISWQMIDDPFPSATLQVVVN
ncbi:hypothetical protein THRCLA_00912 [Thraustotheca clavata]|uniref:Secreted protein n=1 Tax=Thraustotheca clavata TaxID=74557 RepID=A0A0A7CLW1_9STRA|nr:secreted protein [Thraustotheca clavata]OQS07083.1 hypothetical protein THRCLA_00912 [Thraustotheca clavata]